MTAGRDPRDPRPGEAAVADIVQASTGAAAREIRPLPTGKSVFVWRVETDTEPLAVLVQRPAPRRADARFEAQFAILDRLHPLDGRVPRPIATNESVGAGGGALEDLVWAVMSLAPGEEFGEAGRPPAAARALGELLARLHSLPAEGHGMLEQRRDAIRGPERDVRAGLLSRWPRLWPFDGSSLSSHPIARAAPHMLDDLARFREPLLRSVERRPAVALHSDLSRGNIFVADGRLSCLIDFGDAFVGPPVVDCGSFVYHYGWELTEALTEGYDSTCAPRGLPEVRLADVRLFAIAVGLRQFRTAAGFAGSGLGEARLSEWMDSSVRFLEETLLLAGADVRR